MHDERGAARQGGAQRVEQRPWYERLFDRDNSAGPIVVVVLLILAIVLVLVLGPMLDRVISGS